jgi:hypothetical protein
MTNDTLIKKTINWNFWIPAILFLLFLIIEDQAFHTYYTSWLYGLILILVGIMYSFRYKLYQPALVICLAGITLWHYILAAHFDTSITMLRSAGIAIPGNPDDNPFSMLIWIINLMILLILLPLMGPVILKAYKLELSARRLFRTAAQMVSTSKDGFTSRPYHAGNVEYSKEQIIGFTQYLSGQMIVHPVFTETGVYLTLSMGKSPLSIHDPTEISYIAFESTGNITVHIASLDYKKFSKELTFDRLCESLSDVFKRFMAYYKDGHEMRIITELKSV